MILIGKVGKIIKGPEKGWFIKVQDDKENTGGFLILQSKNQDFSSEGFDDWVESMQDLERFFENEEWAIEWLNN